MGSWAGSAGYGALFYGTLAAVSAAGSAISFQQGQDVAGAAGIVGTILSLAAFSHYAKGAPTGAPASSPNVEGVTRRQMEDLYGAKIWPASTREPPAGVEEIKVVPANQDRNWAIAFFGGLAVLSGVGAYAAGLAAAATGISALESISAGLAYFGLAQTAAATALSVGGVVGT